MTPRKKPVASDASPSLEIFRQGRRDPRGGILLHGERPDWVYLNPTALEIVELRRAGLPVREISRRLAARHGIGPTKVETDVRKTLARLAAEGFELRRPTSLRRAPRLKDLFVHITERCNLACRHCYYACSPSRTLDLPADRLIEIVSEHADLGGREISLSGGEPFLHPDFKRILSAAAPRLQVKIATNGVLIDDAWAAFLAPFHPRIQISLDGPDARTHDAIRGKGAFAGALRAIERLQKAGLGDGLSLAATMQDGNAGRLDDIIRLTRRLGIPGLRFLPLRRAGRAGDKWGRVGARTPDRIGEDLYAHIRATYDPREKALSVTCGVGGFIPHRPTRDGGDGFWCPVGSYLSIAADGSVHPCVLLMEDRFLLGNILNSSLKKILDSRAMNGVCRTLADRRKKIPKCARCRWRSFCQAGCMALAYEKSGTLYAADRLCAFRKRLYAEAFGRILDHAAAEGGIRAGD